MRIGPNSHRVLGVYFSLMSIGIIEGPRLRPRRTVKPGESRLREELQIAMVDLHLAQTDKEREQAAIMLTEVRQRLVRLFAEP